MKEESDRSMSWIGVLLVIGMLLFVVKSLYL